MADMLKGVHPDLVDKISKVLDAMAAHGFPMKVVQGLRTTEQQQAIYAQGRTKPGKIVTNIDGLKVKSNHQAHLDGFGHAVDCCFQGDNPFGEKQPWSLYGTLVASVGLTWGGNWHSLIDRPHAEMKETV